MSKKNRNNIMSEPVLDLSKEDTNDVTENIEEVEEAVEVEEVDTNTEEVIENTESVEEIPTPVVDTVVEEHIVTEDPYNGEAPMPTVDEADPLHEVPGKYYLSLGDNFPGSDFDIVEARLHQLKLNHAVTATGQILIGPYISEEDAIEMRRTIMRKGLRGEVIVM